MTQNFGPGDIVKRIDTYTVKSVDSYGKIFMNNDRTGGDTYADPGIVEMVKKAVKPPVFGEVVTGKLSGNRFVHVGNNRWTPEDNDYTVYIDAHTLELYYDRSNNA